jgi:hypothetical protein
VPTDLAPYEKTNLGRERLRQRHRRLALASIASHNSAMTPDLAADDKAILAALPRSKSNGPND